MPQNGTFIECWSYVLLSVGLARLFLSLSRWIWCHFRLLSQNRLKGTIPDAISALVKLTALCALISFFFSVGFVRLSLAFSRGLFFLFIGSSRTTFQEVCLFIYRDFQSNRLAGTIPAQISALVKLGILWVLASFLFSVDQSFSAF